VTVAGTSPGGRHVKAASAPCPARCTAPGNMYSPREVQLASTSNLACLRACDLTFPAASAATPIASFVAETRCRVRDHDREHRPVALVCDLRKMLPERTKEAGTRPGRGEGAAHGGRRLAIGGCAQGGGHVTSRLSGAPGRVKWGSSHIGAPRIWRGRRVGRSFEDHAPLSASAVFRRSVCRALPVARRLQSRRTAPRLRLFRVATTPLQEGEGERQLGRPAHNAPQTD